MKIDLDEDDVSLLCLLLGYATGAADKGDLPVKRGRVLALANKVNANNPQWTPYEVDAEKAEA